MLTEAGRAVRTFVHVTHAISLAFTETVSTTMSRSASATTPLLHISSNSSISLVLRRYTKPTENDRPSVAYSRDSVWLQPRILDIRPLFIFISQQLIHSKCEMSLIASRKTACSGTTCKSSNCSSLVHKYVLNIKQQARTKSYLNVTHSRPHVLVVISL